VGDEVQITFSGEEGILSGAKAVAHNMNVKVTRHFDETDFLFGFSDAHLSLVKQKTGYVVDWGITQTPQCIQIVCGLNAA